MDFFDAGFIQPVSVRGLRLYRFESGDTMQIQLPGRTITLVEVVVRPREADWEMLEGSLWFDSDNGVLVRAAYRPSGVWDMDVREPGDLADVPGFLKPAIGTVRSVVIEYGLFEQRWWLPRRVVGDGIFEWGDGLVRMPLTLEWTLSGHIINEAPRPDITAGPDFVPVGRRVFGDDRRRQRIQYLAPAGVDLGRAPELPAPIVAGEPFAFSRAEMAPLLARLEQVAGLPPEPRAAPIKLALLTSLRYDRVSGLNAGYALDVDAGRFRFTPELRLATAVPDAFARFQVSRGSTTLTGYRGLADASDWNIAGSLGNSTGVLLFGHDGGDYYRVSGGSLAWTFGGAVMRARIEAFAELQRPIERQTDFSLATLGGGSLRPNLRAARLDLVGARADLAGQLDAGVQSAVLNWRVRGEAAAGGGEYARAMASLRITGPVSEKTAAAFEVAAGVAGNGVPPQREFLLGGVATLRGVAENTVVGPAFWLARAEGGAGPAGLRGLLFFDIGWAGPRGAVAESRPTAGAGVGASIMDGLLRMDVARGVLRSSSWRAYFYIDALL
jgi:hypothetical protein